MRIHNSLRHNYQFFFLIFSQCCQNDFKTKIDFKIIICSVVYCDGSISTIPSVEILQLTKTTNKYLIELTKCTSECTMKINHGLILESLPSIFKVTITAINNNF